MITLGTYNTWDGKGTVTPFADVILLTEAVPEKVRAQIGSTHCLYVCDRQRDLIIAVRKSLDWNLEAHYKRAHPGVAKVTPNRGTFWLTDDDRKIALLVEHRINAAFAPFKRGEGLYRRAMWSIHTRMTLRIIRRLKRDGYTVHAGGDLNTPRGISGYRGVLNEVGKGLDRIGSTRKLTDVQVLSPNGSDHHRLRATVR